MSRLTNYLRISICLVTACAALGVLGAGDMGMAQSPRKSKLAPPQVFQPPFPYSLGIVAQYELGYRMQNSVPELTDVSKEPDAI